ncbi:MAG: hypothetical protein M1497_06890 [Nitrospirae bacterium]|nr:hypothetical protein [Nitrospirota bacterium]
MRYPVRYLLLAMACVLAAVAAYAESGEVTPYGDYPHWHSAYGMCKESLDRREAEAAIERYFASRGLRAVHMQHKDRFVTADIYKGNRLFDRILFDRKTGRIRSIN